MPEKWELIKKNVKDLLEIIAHGFAKVYDEELVDILNVMLDATDELRKENEA